MYVRRWMIVVWGALLLWVGAPGVFGDIDFNVANAWSRALQYSLKELEVSALQADQVVSMVNGFIMNHPDRLNPDRKWVDSLAKDVDGLLASRVAAAKALAQKAEQIFGSNPPPQGLCDIATIFVLSPIHTGTPIPRIHTQYSLLHDLV